MDEYDILYMYQAGCPYCRRAEKYINELTAEDPRYAALTIRRVDEDIEAAFADTLDYYYVPTFYVGGQKLHEGVPTPEKIRAVLDAALRQRSNL